MDDLADSFNFLFKKIKESPRVNLTRSAYIEQIVAPFTAPILLKWGTLRSWSVSKHADPNGRKSRNPELVLQVVSALEKWFVEGNAVDVHVRRHCETIRKYAADISAVHKPSLAGDGAVSNDDVFIGSAPIIERIVVSKEAQLKRSRTQGEQDWGVELECLRFLAALSSEQDDWNRACQYRNEIVSRLTEIGDPSAIIAARNDLGMAQYRAFRWDDGILNLQECLKMAQAQGLDGCRQYCRTLDYLAINHRALARQKETKEGLDQARNLLEKSLEIRRSLKSPTGIASTCHRLGHVFTQWTFRSINDREDIEQYLDYANKATMYLEEARALRLKVHHMLDYCRSTNQLARHLVTLNPNQNATQIEILLNESLSFSKRLSIRETLIQAQINYARFYRKAGRQQEAKQKLAELRGTDLKRRCRDFDIAQIYEESAKLAELYDKAAARKFWKRAEEIWGKANNHLGVRRTKNRRNRSKAIA